MFPLFPLNRLFWRKTSRNPGLEDHLGLLIAGAVKKRISRGAATRTFSAIMNNVESMVSDRWNYRGSELGDDDSELLRRIIYLLVTPLQAAMNARLLLAQTDISGGPAEISFKSLWFDPYVPITDEGKSVHDIAVAYGDDLPEINLLTSRILPWPWNQGRLHGTLASIGDGRPLGPWREDPLNHFVSAISPLGIGLCGGGNHSIAAGIVMGEGAVRVSEIYDLARVYPYVQCDGKTYKRTHDGAVISTVSNPVLAAVFEIGRMIDQMERQQETR